MTADPVVLLDAVPRERSRQGAQLIYDVGLCDGSDTAYYLKLGFDVVAIEANTTLAQAGARRFAGEIAAGWLQIANVGIAAIDGVERFWVCDDHAEWSSFDRKIASRNGCAHHAVRIPTVSFASALEQYGVPYYCKIDIEGNDHLCLQALRSELCPAYISVELPRSPCVDPLERLCELGYTRFKIIDQRRFCSVEPTIQRLLCAPSPVGPAAERINRAARSRLSHRGWRFAVGSSGAIGPATAGRWISGTAVRRVASWVQRHMQSAGLSEWFDLHAAQ